REKSLALLREIYENKKPNAPYDGDYSSAILQLGAINLADNKAMEAKKWYEKVLLYEESAGKQGTPSNKAWAALSYGQCDRDLHKYSDALLLYKKALLYCDELNEGKDSEFRTKVYRQLADCYVNLSDDKSAARYFRIMASFHPLKDTDQAENCDY